MIIYFCLAYNTSINLLNVGHPCILYSKTISSKQKPRKSNWLSAVLNNHFIYYLTTSLQE